METSRLVQSSTAAADRRPEDGFSHISNSWTSFARSPPSMGCCPTDQRNNSAMESEENIWQWRSSTASTARRLVVEQASAAEQSKDISLSATPATAELLKMGPHKKPMDDCDKWMNRIQFNQGINGCNHTSRPLQPHLLV
eukprot:GHVS01000983.1.p1 GENE.GHVS01000983.1~~GHVS01000983.1.p1  ORF type:complete len:140 (-),score=22.51 GHVS01000983.1:314-733(-)